MIKRPLVWILGAYLAGIYLAWQKYSFIIVVILIFCSATAIYLLIYRIKNRWFNQRDVFLWCAPFLLLLGYFSMNTQLQKPVIYGAFDDEVSCELNGRISMVVEKAWGRALYVHDNVIILSGEEPYLCENVIVFCSDDQSYQIGNQITVKGNLQKFSVAANPGQFNEQLYYQIENIDFKMEAEEITITDGGYSIYHAALGKIKTKLIAVYNTILSENEGGALIAMLLGEKYLLKDEIKQLYQENGISHLLAISGLHVSLIGMFIFELLRRCKVPITPATYISIFFIYSYGVLTNFSVSTNRAVVMMVVLLLSTLAGKTYDMISAMALSAFLILLQNPLQILSAGFLLSFGAVLGISILFPCLKQLFKQRNSVLDSLLISTGAQLSTTPFVLYFYYQFPVYSIITNLFILPFVTILTLTSLLAGIAGTIYLPLGVFLIGGANYILKFYEALCRIGANIPGNLITVGKPDFLRLMIYTILMITFVWLTRRSGKKYFMLIPLVAFTILIIPQRNAGLEVTFIDVGQGDGIYMESHSGTTYLVDGGSSVVKNVGKYRLQPFLLSQGTDILDYAVITHSDSDHISGLKELILNDQIKIKRLLLPYIKDKDEAYHELEELAIEKGIKLTYLKAGDSIVDGELHIICLHPSANYIPQSANSYSTVLSITYGNFDMLLTGDLLPDGEELITEFIQNKSNWESAVIQPPLQYDVLKVAHHGSKYSSVEDFLSFICPRISVISCGKNNTYGHPHQELINRLEDIGSEIKITYDCGAITIETDGEKMEIYEFIREE